jgi:hypothetical protein
MINFFIELEFKVIDWVLETEALAYRLEFLFVPGNRVFRIIPISGQVLQNGEM